MINHAFDISFMNTSDYEFWNYSSILPNKAILNMYHLFYLHFIFCFMYVFDLLSLITLIYFYAFTRTTNFTFANETHLTVRNTLKVAFFVAGWPFRNTRSELVVWLGSNSTNRPITDCDVYSRADTNDNLKWVSITVDNQTLYAHFLDVCFPSLPFILVLVTS